ncbi:MAG: glycosyltransferase [Lachnospiraceae bacterium]|nr:glycosyltransferase [Lachnospiraceae bacterium]
MTQSEKLISVIVTAYNIEDYLPKCMDSLLAQTYSNMEIIVVDDGSVDGTGKICDEYASKNEKTRVIHKENGGPSSARNAGLKIANGEYIGYVDGDDWIEPDMYQDMLKACEDTGAQIAICTYKEVGEGSKEVHPTGNVIELSRDEAMDFYISGHPQYHIYHSVWSKLFRREVIKDIAFQEGRKSEDIMYTTWALTKASKCVFLDTAYYNYRMDREDSIMHTKIGERRFRDEIPFWKEQMGYLEGIGMHELVGKASYEFYKRMLYYYIDFRQTGMKKQAVELAGLLKSERTKINKIYEKPFVKTGDKVRMKVFLFSPGLYYLIVRLYDQVIIPLRQ